MVLFPLGLLPGATRADEVVAGVVTHAAAHPSGAAPASFDRTAYAAGAEQRKQLPIGVFDSGIGGLTVLEAILSLDVFDNGTLQPGADGIPDFAEERFVYLGDQANMPYGRYPSEEKEDFLRELILKDAVFLLGRRWRSAAEEEPRFDKPPVKAIVIACNTATAFGLEDIRSAFEQWGVPVIVVGVVEAGARGVLESRRGSGGGGAEAAESGAIGVMATVGTCDSGAYPALINRVLGRAGHGPPAITQQGSANLAAVIEGNPAYAGTVADQALVDVRELVENHRDSGLAEPLETVVLGCTHYPLALAEIEDAFDVLRRDEPELAPFVAARRIYVDPAEWAARELFRELAQAKLRLKPGEGEARESGRKDLFFLSVPHPDSPLSADGKGLDLDYQYGRSPGDPGREDTVVVPLTRESLPDSGATLVREKLPEVWRRLSE